MNMKKTLLFAMIGFSVATLCSCGNITVKGADGTEYESYQECCAANDFEAAHLYLTKMQNKEIEGYSAAKEYVFQKEALYLMSLGDEGAKKRIIYLLKEDGDDKAIISKLMDLAIVNDDAEFVITLINQYGDGIINNPTVISYLVSKNSKMYSDIVLVKIPSVKTKRPPLGENTFYGSGLSTSEFEENCEKYKKEVASLNNAISKILNVAITSKNQYVAKNVISKLKPNIQIEDIGFVDNVHYKYKVVLDNSEYDEITKIYREAVQEGKFNNNE